MTTDEFRKIFNPRSIAVIGASSDPRKFGGRAYLMMGYCALQTNKKKRAAEALQKAKGFPKQRRLAGELLKHIGSR